MDYLEGRLILAGVNPAELSARQWLSVVYATVVDSVDGMVDRAKVLQNVTDWLDTPLIPDRERFGTDPAAQRGQRAMMDLADGPAPMRDPNKPRPAAWANRQAQEVDDTDGDRRGVHRGSP